MNLRNWSIAMLLVSSVALTGCGGEGTVTVSPPSEPTVAPTSQPPALEATVVDVINDVDAHPLPEPEWEDARVDMTIYLGGEVWAQEASTARVGVEEGLVRVAPNTIFTLDQPEADAVRLDLSEGQVWIDIEGLAPGEVFEVQTPAAVASVRGTRFGVRTLADGGSLVSTQVGTVTVEAATAAVTLTPGLQTTVPSGGAPGAPEPMSPEEQVRWGMAAGSGLDVALPAVGESAVFTYTGYTFSRDWSPSEDVVVVSYYDAEASAFEQLFYDVVAGEPISMPLPTPAGGVFYNPAGGSLAYQSVGDDSTNQICVVDLDGVTQSCFGGDASYGWPFWSPDGEWIVFYSARGLAGPGYNLFRARPDGSELTALTSNEAGYSIRQSWSPDGEWIAFVQAPGYNDAGDLWIMRADGSDARRLFEGVYGNGFDHAAWSPDGSTLAVPAAAGGLVVVPVDGSEAWVVPGTDDWQCWSPVWSPSTDGWPLFFGSAGPNDGQVGMWYAPRGGVEPTSFLDAVRGPLWGPFWSPGGNRVLIGFEERVGDSRSVEVVSLPAAPAFWP
jgi:hypothetical protein